MTQYPRDEFDNVPESTSRQGVHRERLVTPRSGGLGLIITVGLLVLLVGLAAYFVLPRMGFTMGDDGSGEAVTTPVSSPAPTDPASASASASAAEERTEEPTEDPTANPEGSEPAAEESAEPGEPAALANKSQPVAVMNATVVPGMAGSVAQRISADGWTPGDITNWAGQRLQTSIIYYNGTGQLPNAQALSALLGIPTLVDSAAVGPLAVVLGPGFQ